MANGGNIRYSVGFNVDKAGLNQIKASLQELKQITAGDFLKINPGGNLATVEAEIQKIRGSVGQLETALNKAFNTNLGTLNVSKFNQELKKLKLNEIYADMSKLGAAGQNAFRNTTAQVLTTNMQLKQTHKLLDNMATTMANTVKWGAASSVMNSFTGSVQQAYGYVKNLDSSLNDIRIVTGYSAEAMDKFAEKANKAAKALGQSTTDYTEASLIYYQQGLSDKEVEARTETTLKAANVTGQSGEEVSEQLTAVWNGYKVSAQEAELYVDKLAAVAATTASDLEELSVGMSKVASAADLMGVDVDQLNATLATVVSVTRQAPESVGTAFKTIYARMGDIEAGLDTETTLGDYTEKMNEIAGINVLDANNQLRDMGEVIEEVGNKWTTMSREQQIALSQVMAGTRQYNNLLSLFDNWDMYTEALNTSANAAGTLQEQQDIYMESTAAHLQQLRTSMENIYDSIFDSKSINGVIDGLTVVTDLTGNFIDAIGGGGRALLLLGTIATQVFGRQIASSIATSIINFQTAKENISKIKAEMEILSQYENANINDARTLQLIDMKRQVLDLDKSITNEERNIANEYIKQQNELYKQQDALNEKLKLAQEVYQRTTGEAGNFSTQEGRDAAAAELDDRRVNEFDSLLKNDSVVNFENTMSAVKKAYTELNNIRQQGNQSAEAEETATNKLTKAKQDLQGVVEGQISQAENLISVNTLSEERQEALVKAVNEYNKLTEDGTKFNAENALHIAAATKVQNVFKRVVKETSAELEVQSRNLRNHKADVDSLDNSIQNLSTDFNRFIKAIDLRATIQNFTTMIGKVGQIASAFNSLKQIPSIFNNDDLSTGEKVLQIVTSLSMGFPMLINGITGTATAFKTLRASITEAVIMMEIEKALEAEGLATLGARNTAQAMQLVFKKAGIKLTEEEIKKLTAETALEMLEQKIKEKGIQTEVKENVVKQMNIVLQKAESTSIWKTVAAYIAKIAVMAGPYLLAAAAITAAIIAVVKANEAEAKAFEKANESLKRQTEIVSRLREEHEALQELIEGYEDAYNSIKDLTKGTEEYSQAIIQANEKAVELIETLGLFGQWEYGEDGLIIIKQDAVQSAYDQKTKDVAASEVNLQTAYQRVNNADWELLKKSSNLDYLFDEDVRNFANLSDELYSELKNLASSDLGYEEYLSTLTSLGERYDAANLPLDLLANTIISLGEDADETRNQLQKMLIEEDYRNEQIAKSIAEYKNLFDGNELAANAYGNLVSQNEEFQEVTKQNSEIANQNVDNFQLKPLLEKYEGGKTWGSFGISDKELAKYYAKYVEKWTDDEIKKAKYEKGTGEGTLTSGDKTFSMEDEDMRQDLMQALLSLNLSEGLDADGEKAYDDIQIQDTINSILNSNLEQSTQDAVLTAMSNYDESKKFEGLDLSLIHPDDMQTLLSQAEELGGDLGVALTEKLNSVSPEEQQELYNNRLEEQHSQNIDAQAQAEGLNTDVLERQTELILENTEALEGNKNAAKQLAVNNALMNKGMETLIDNWEDWGKVLKKGDKTSTEYAETIDEVSTCFEDLVGLSDGMGKELSSSFFDSAENLALLDEAAKGSEEAVEELGYAVAENLTNNMDFDAEGWAAKIAEMGEAFEGIQFSDGLATSAAEMQTHFDTAKTAVLSGIEQIKNAELGVGDNLANALSPEDLSNFVNGLNNMALATGMSVQEMQGMLNSLGLQATVTTTPVPTTYQVPIMRTEEQIINNGENGEPIVKESKTWQVGTESETGIMDVAQVSYDGNTPGAAPITKIGRGSVSTGNKGKASGGGGKGGGGGGGSKPKKEDKVESKKDRYHDVNVKLSQIDEDLEDIGRKQEKLFGKDLIDALEEELDLLEKQRDVLNDKLEIAKEEQAELQKSLKAEGVEFNKDGTIKNYMEIMTAKENALNAMIDKYNHMSAADQEKYQETLDNAKEEYEKFVEMLGNYDDLLLETIPEIENTIQDITDREIEIQIQKLNMEVELRLDLTEAQKEWNEFKREAINGVDSDDIFGNALADADLFSEILHNGTMEALTNNINNTMDQIKSINETGTSSIFGDDKQAALDNLDEQMSNLMDHMSELTDLQKQISEAYLDMIDEVGEAFDEQIESYEYVGDLINHNMNMIKLVNGEDAYAEMAQVYKKQKENNLSIMQSQKAAVDYYRQMMETETDPEAVEKWTELWKGAVEDLNSTVEGSVEWIIEEYGNAVNEIFDRLDDKMTNGKGLDYLTQEWELKNENADQYLDTINSTYEIQKLERKIQDSINNTDSLSAQKKLNDFMDEELEMLREKEKLTQYDVDRANALYEVKLKEIALEEAQQNKSQMRLRRDASGNYSYQFVADQDSISKAQQELDDARNSLYNMDKDEYRENQQEILDVYTEFQEKMREAANLSAEEKELIEQQYNERINALLEENGYIRTNLMESAFADLAALYGSDIANFQQMSMEEQDILMGQIVPNWDSGIQDMIDTMTNPETGFGPMCKLAMEELDLATQEYNESLAMIKQTSEDSFGAAQEGYTTNIELARELAEAQQTNIDRTKEEKDAIGELKLEVDNLVQSYKDAYTAAKDALTAAQKLREYEAEQAAKEAAKNNPGGSGGSGDGDKGSKGDTGGKDGGNGGGKTRLTSEIIDGVAGAIWYWSPSAWGTGNERKQKMESKFGAGAYNTIQSYINDHVTVGGKMKKSFNYGWGERNKYKNYYYSKFDTGGYTGDWPGSDGRMAMLHKKELVLNADDTKNFLSAINLVRDMESMLAAMNDSMLSRTSGMTASLAPSLGFDDAASNTVNQNVSIQASFPGVSSRAEIEEAFQNLVNIASQHAFNTQR